MIYNNGLPLLMISSPNRADDMPLLSQWIKKTMENVSFSIVFLVEPTGVEPVSKSSSV